MNRICVITAAWKRPAVLEAALDNWRAVGVHEICIALSPGDTKAELLSRYYDCHSVSMPNENLAAKFNAACRLARNTDCDYFLHMGADDLIGESLMTEYLRFKGHYLGTKDWYFHSLDRDITMYWPGYEGQREGEPIGAGRLVSRTAMNTIDFAPFSGAGNNELDSVQHRALTRHVRSEVISLKELSAVGVDLKDADSMTQFDRVAKLMDECPHLEHLDPFIWESAKRAKP